MRTILLKFLQELIGAWFQCMRLISIAFA